MDNELKKELENEVNDLWEKELKNEISQKMNTFCKALSEQINEKLNNFAEEMKQKGEKIILSNKLNQFKPKTKNYNMYLEYQEDSNYLLNPVLMSLININLFDYICLKNDSILKILNMKKENNVFSLIIQLLNKKINEEKISFDPFDIHKQFKLMMGEKFNSDNPAILLNFILSNLVNELNCEKNTSLQKISDNDDEEAKKNFEKMKENNNNEILDKFFVTYKTIYKCKECDHTILFNYQKIPTIKLFISESDQKLFNEVKLNETFSFYLNDNDSNEVKYKCQNCKKESKAIVINTIEEMNDILIVELNRENDKNLKMNVKYGSLLKFKPSNKTYELISVLMRKKIIPYKNYYLVDQNNIYVYFKNSIDNKWYLFNDEEIKLVEKEEEIFDDTNALILIYKKK